MQWYLLGASGSGACEKIQLPHGSNFRTASAMVSKKRSQERRVKREKIAMLKQN